MSSDIEWVTIGRLQRVRGNRGELLAELDSADSGREQKLKQVALFLNGRRQVFPIEEAWRHDGRPVFKFAGIDSINDAEPWQRAEIQVPREDVAAPEEGAYSHQDLVGCRFTNAGVELGVVKEVEDFGGPPLLKIETADGREILVPFARAICKKIDVNAKVIEAELPEGLLDL